MSDEAQSSEYDQELENHLVDFVDQEENDEASVQTVKPLAEGAQGYQRSGPGCSMWILSLQKVHEHMR